MQSSYFSDRDIDFYHANGYLLFNAEFPKHLLGKIHHDIVELLERKRESLFPNDQRKRETEFDLHHKSQAVQELITSDVFADLCQKLIGQDIDLRFCFTLTKTEKHGEPVEWHQDRGLDKDPGYPRISFWVAITDSNIENGCIRLVPGSQNKGILPHTMSKKSPPDIGIEGVDVQKAIPLEMKAGEVLIIHPQVIHGSDSCVSNNPRVAVLGSYQSPKKTYNEFWAKAGSKFLRGGKKEWAPIEVNSK